MHVILSLVLVLIAGCSQSSGVLKLGPDTYTTSATASPGGPSEAQKLALSKANKHCDKLGKEIMVTSIGTNITNIGVGKAEVTFRCLAKDDPSLQRPEFRQTPDVTIEDRRR